MEPILLLVLLVVLPAVRELIVVQGRVAVHPAQPVLIIPAQANVLVLPVQQIIIVQVDLT